ncbi:MAG: signal peptidase II [Oscillospiraceae bacterium]|nr:signal peptidase II [Oscillospiraceae bacterium]
MIIITAVLAAADQLIKIWAVRELAGGVSKQFLKIADNEIINLTYTENTGAAFSIMSGKQWFTIGFATLALVIFAVYVIKNYRNSKPAMIFSAMVISGGIGNLIDRVRIGYVVDYIEVRLFRFAIFNFADVCVTVGIVLLMIYVLFFSGKSRQEIPAENETEISDE